MLKYMSRFDIEHWYPLIKDYTFPTAVHFSNLSLQFIDITREDALAMTLFYKDFYKIKSDALTPEHT